MWVATFADVVNVSWAGYFQFATLNFTNSIKIYLEHLHTGA